MPAERNPAPRARSAAPSTIERSVTAARTRRSSNGANTAATITASTTSPPKRQKRGVRWLWIGLIGACIALLGAATGYVVSSRAPTLYAARTEILFQLTEDQPTGFLREDRNLTTQLVLLRSRAVLSPIADQFDIPLVELEEKISASLVGSSEVLRIQVADGVPERAANIAAAVAERYLALATESGDAEARQFLEQQIDDIDTQLATKREELRELRSSETSTATGSPDGELDVVETEIDALLNRREEVSAQLDDITVRELTRPRLEVLTPAYVLEDPVSPKPLLGTTAGFALGLLVAAGVVALIARRRTA
jgi:uncharacterized protein involved in exopolysaccharide biosynthesis